LPASEVDRSPAQRGYLAAPHPAHDREQHRDKHAGAREMSEQSGRVRRIQRYPLSALDLRRIDAIDGIARQHPPAHSRRQRLFQNAVRVVDGARGEAAGPVPATRFERFRISRDDLVGFRAISR
jgi:hypothetical protein